MSNEFNIDNLKQLLDFDQEHMSKSRERQSQFWRGEKLDSALIFLGGELKPGQEQIPDCDFHEMCFSKEKMLCREARASCYVANTRSDAVPSIRANLGTGIMLSCLGLEQEIFPDKMPWLHQHMTKEQISKLEPDDFYIRGSFAKGMEMMQYFLDTVGGYLPIYVMDTQGPFDLAHLLMGDDLFVEMYDDPQFVHHLMNICTEGDIKAHRWMKELIGEPLTSLHHSCSIYSDSFGIRICEDTTALLSPDLIDEFAMPYTRRLASEFGGAWVHYCGYNEALTDAILACPEVKALNFGHIPGHEQEIDFYMNMEKFDKTGKINFNSWPVLPGENAEGYLTRLHTYSSQGILAPYISSSEKVLKEAFGNQDKIYDFWRDLD